MIDKRLNAIAESGKEGIEECSAELMTVKENR